LQQVMMKRGKKQGATVSFPSDAEEAVPAGAGHLPKKEGTKIGSYRYLGQEEKGGPGDDFVQLRRRIRQQTLGKNKSIPLTDRNWGKGAGKK